MYCIWLHGSGFGLYSWSIIAQKDCQLVTGRTFKTVLVLVVVVARPGPRHQVVHTWIIGYRPYISQVMHSTVLVNL